MENTLNIGLNRYVASHGYKCATYGTITHVCRSDSITKVAKIGRRLNVYEIKPDSSAPIYFVTNGGLDSGTPNHEFIWLRKWTRTEIKLQQGCVMIRVPSNSALPVSSSARIVSFVCQADLSSPRPPASRLQLSDIVSIGNGNLGSGDC